MRVVPPTSINSSLKLPRQAQRFISLVILDLVKLKLAPIAGDYRPARVTAQESEQGGSLVQLSLSRRGKRQKQDQSYRVALSKVQMVSFSQTPIPPHCSLPISLTWLPKLDFSSYGRPIAIGAHSLSSQVLDYLNTAGKRCQKKERKASSDLRWNHVFSQGGGGHLATHMCRWPICL